MSKIEQMIEELCPDGVEYRKLGEIDQISIRRGVRVVRNQLCEEGEIPVYQNSLIPLGYHSEANSRENSTFIICAGSAGSIGYSDCSFWAADDCFVFDCNRQYVNDRYIYHALLNTQYKLLSQVRKASVPRLSRTAIENLEIPVPPLTVQEEIVRILDKFTQLEAELEAELDCRKRQYEYYRDKLLSFDVLGGRQVKWMKMSEIFEFRNGYTPSKAKPEFWEEGTIPWFRMEDIRENGRILSDAIQYITPDAVKGKGLFSANSFILATSATIGEHALITVDSLTNQRFTNLKIRESLIHSISIKYMYHYFFIIDNWCKEHVNVSGFASVDMKGLKNLLIPVPPLSEQQRIADILDRFEALTTDISQGLPAEIRARRQQYEYYRDKLLTFNRKLA